MTLTRACRGLEPGTTKNAEVREFHFAALDELRDLLRDQLTDVERLKKDGVITSFVFHMPDGGPIRILRDQWRAATEDAGHPGKLLHDFRRTAVRNLERAGVPRSVAMKLVGHKTESIYRRYAIVDAGMLRDGAAKLNALGKLDSQPARGQVRKFRAS